MRLRFLLKKCGPDGSPLPATGRVFFIDPLKTPTVASVVEFVCKKCDIEGEVVFYLDGYLVDPTDSVAVFDHDDVIVVGSKDSQEVPDVRGSNLDGTQLSAAAGTENSTVMRSILKKRKTVSICGLRSEDEASFVNLDTSMVVNPPETPRADITLPPSTGKKRKLEDVGSSTEEESESEDSSSEESMDDEPPKPPAEKKKTVVVETESSEEESSDDEPPKPPPGMLKKPVPDAESESEESESEEEERKKEPQAPKMAGVMDSSTVVASQSDVSADASGRKKRRKRKRGKRNKGKVDGEQQKTEPKPVNDTINLSSDVNTTGGARLPKEEWDKLRRNKRRATVSFVPAAHQNRNKHVRFEPSDPEDQGGAMQASQKVDEAVEPIEPMDDSPASTNGGGFGGNASYTGRVADLSADFSRRFQPSGFTKHTPSAASTPLRLMPRQVRMPRLTVPQGWSVSKNTPVPEVRSPAAPTPSSPRITSQNASPVVRNSPADSALKTVHLNESQTNKSRIYRSPLAVANGSQGQLEPDDANLEEPFDLGSDTDQKSIANGNAELIEKSYEDYPLLKPKQPKKGDKVAFKILEMSANMCPEISDYKEGTVLEFNPSTDTISLQVTVQPKPPAEDDEEGDEENVGATLKNGIGIEILDAKWTNVIEPRLMT